MHPELAGLPETQGRASWRALRFFLSASVLAHAGALVVAPGVSFESAFAVPGVLEVTILKPEPLTLAAPALFPAPPLAIPQAPPATKRARAKNVREPGRVRQDPPRATPGRQPGGKSSSMVAPPAPTPEPGNGRKIEAGSEPEAGSASAPETPPSFPAAYLSNPPPGYPQAARRAGEQGTVILRVLVRRDGLPASVEIESPSGSLRLDAAARDAVGGWRFVPARRGADPIESWVRVPVVFRLEGAS